MAEICTIVSLFCYWLSAVIKPSSVFSASSVPQILKQSSVNILLALGEFFAILIAGIDLSVGSVAALTGLFTAKMMIVGVPVPLAILAGILIGTFFGFINGMLVNKTDFIHLLSHWVPSPFSAA